MGELVAADFGGEVAFASGDLPAAERAFLAAEPPLKMWFNMGSPSTSLVRNNFPFRDGAARVLLARGNVDGAIDAYRRLLTPDMSQKWTAILEPRLILQLARALERKGDRSSARQEYQRFLDLWKRADGGLTRVDRGASETHHARKKQRADFSGSGRSSPGVSRLSILFRSPRNNSDITGFISFSLRIEHRPSRCSTRLVSALARVYTIRAWRRRAISTATVGPAASVSVRTSMGVIGGLRDDRKN